MEKEFKVIEIMNEKELLINYGYEQGAEVGDKVRIYSIGEKVIDPDDDGLLGTLDIIKDNLEIYIVYDNFSICRKLQRTNYSPILNPLASLNKTRTESMDLNIRESDITGRELPSNPPPIEVGDKVAILE